jgi:putative transposase
MGYAYKIRDQQGCYFITCTVVQWIDVFTRRQYADIIVGSLRHCIKHKGLHVYGWVIMSNHIHLIISGSEENDLSNILRDFKKYTSSTIVDAIENNPGESRRNWLLWLLKNEDEITFWQPDNHPEEIISQAFFLQKLNYIHQNPIRAGIVDREEDYIYSSARDFHNIKGLVELSYFT